MTHTCAVEGFVSVWVSVGDVLWQLYYTSDTSRATEIYYVLLVY